MCSPCCAKCCGSGMRVLVTGGCGFVGGAAARTLAAAGHEVVALDSAASGQDGGDSFTAAGGVRIVADVRDDAAIERVLAAHPVDAVLHAAAFPSVASCAADPVGAFDVNVTGTARVTATAARHGARRVVTVSSEEAYGEFRAATAAEDDRAAPVSVYGASKVAAELAGGTVARSAGIEHVAARLSWAYGPGYPRPRLPRSMILDALAGRVTFLSAGAGHRVDLTYIDDAADAFRLLIEAPVLDHDVYNVASGVSYSTVEIARVVQGLRPEWRFEIGPGLLAADDGTPLPRKGALEIRRLGELGYAPRVSLAEGIRREYAAIAGLRS
jgi:nucleoside-diphosphate-sugar epimerase